MYVCLTPTEISGPYKHLQRSFGLYWSVYSPNTHQENEAHAEHLKRVLSLLLRASGMKVAGYNCRRIVHVNSAVFMWRKTRPLLVHFTEFFKLEPKCRIRCLEGCWMFHAQRSDKYRKLYYCYCHFLLSRSRPFRTPDSNSRFQCVRSVGSTFYSLTLCSFVVMTMRTEWLKTRVVYCRMAWLSGSIWGGSPRDVCSWHALRKFAAGCSAVAIN